MVVSDGWFLGQDRSWWRDQEVGDRKSSLHSSLAGCAERWRENQDNEYIPRSLVGVEIDRVGVVEVGVGNRTKCNSGLVDKCLCTG